MLPSAKGMLLVWNSVATAKDAEFNDWYIREHLRERTSIGGFLRGRRFRAVDARQGYFALYETVGPEVLASVPYMRISNNPTERTKRNVAEFRDTVRTVHRIVRQAGDDGGVVATIRVQRDATQADHARHPELPFPPRLDGEGIVGASLTKEDETVTTLPSTEKKSRIVPDGRSDWVYIVEGLTAEAVSREARAIVAMLAGHAVKDIEVGIYAFLCAQYNDGFAGRV